MISYTIIKSYTLLPVCWWNFLFISLRARCHYIFIFFVNHKLPFLDVLIDNNDPSSSLTSVCRKKTFTGLLTNYFSFTSYSYKVGLIKTLVDRAYKINNTWLGFHEDINKLIDILKMNLFPAHLIEKIINRYITGTQSNHHPRGSLPTTSPTFYFKLPYIRHFSVILLSAIAMTWILNWFSLPSKSVTCLVWKTLSLTGSVHVWFISLYVLTVMPVTSVKHADVFPHFLEST